MVSKELLTSDFAALWDIIRAHAAERPDHPALVEDGETLTYGRLAAGTDRIAVALQRDGVESGDAVAIAICATSVTHAAASFGTRSSVWNAATAAETAVLSGLDDSVRRVVLIAPTGPHSHGLGRQDR
jgi:acyl-CoA synthetase (AMP-forming)/AMP-acid ligase II